MKIYYILAIIFLILTDFCELKAETYTYTTSGTNLVFSHTSGPLIYGGAATQTQLTGSVYLPAIDSAKFSINRIDLYLTMDIGAAAWDVSPLEQWLSGSVSTTVSFPLADTDTRVNSSDGADSIVAVSRYQDHLVFSYDPETMILISDIPGIIFGIDFLMDASASGYNAGGVVSEPNRFTFISLPTFRAVYDLNLLTESPGNALPPDDVQEFFYESNSDIVSDTSAPVSEFPSYVAIPEPNAVSMISIGALAVVWLRKRQQG